MEMQAMQEETVLSNKVEQRFKVEDLSLTLSPLTLNPFTFIPSPEASHGR
jgi:hypothetical protein